MQNTLPLQERVQINTKSSEREFMMVIRQAALMVSAHIGRNRAALGDLAIAIDAGLVVIVQWVEWKYDVKRPKVRQ